MIGSATVTVKGHGGSSQVSGQYIVRSAGLVGATVFGNTFHVAGQSRLAASRQFDGIASPYSLAMAYQKLYWAENQQQTGPNTPQPVGDMAAAGIEMLFGLKPSRTLSAANLAAFQGTLSVLKAAAPGSHLTLWPECNYVTGDFFPSASAYQTYVQYYGPSVVAAGFPLAYDPFIVTADGPNITDYFPGTTFNGLPLITEIFADIYCSQWVTNGADLTQIDALARQYNLGLGIAEFGAADNATEPPLSAYENFMASLTATMSARLADGLVNLPVGWYMADAEGTNGLPAGDPKWPSLLTMWRQLSMQSAANTIGGLV